MDSLYSAYLIAGLLVIITGVLSGYITSKVTTRLTLKYYGERITAMEQDHREDVASLKAESSGLGKSLDKLRGTQNQIVFTLQGIIYQLPDINNGDKKAKMLQDVHEMISEKRTTL